MSSFTNGRERGASDLDKGHFVLRMIKAIDIPPPEHKSKPSPYLRAYIAMQVIEVDGDQEHHHLKRISDIVSSPTKLDSNSVTWNSYRDFRIQPPPDSRLIVEVMHETHDPAKPDILLGKAEIHLTRLVEEPITVSLVSPPKIDRHKYPQFSVTLARTFINEEPPKRKVIFLIRHGESKWNEAQSKINITGMLDRDHALTELGIAQAEELNRRWRKEQEKFQPPVKAEDTVVSQNVAPSFATADLLGLDDFEVSTTVSSQPSLPTVLSTSTMPPDRHRTASRDIFSSIPGIDLVEEVDEIQDLENVDNFDEDDEVLSDDEDDLEAMPSNKATKGSSKTTTDLLNAGSAESEVVQEVGSYKSTLLLEEVHTACDMETDRAARVKRINDYKELFLQADKIFSSPLTRALETALISMEDHPVLSSDGLHLYSVIREVKNIGGLDTVGIETGEGIIKRARSELAQVVGTKRSQQLTDISIHINDAEYVWWTPLTAYDNEKEQQARVREFITFMRYCDATLPVFVGHSLFFKAFYSKRISKHLAKNRSQLSHDLQKFRLSNCSMLAVVVTFYDVADGSSEAKLVDADLIFGGGFHGHPNYRNSLERNASLALSEERMMANSMNSSPAGKLLSTGSQDDQDNEPGPMLSTNRRRSTSNAPDREHRSSLVNGMQEFVSAFPTSFVAKKEQFTKELTKGAKKFSDKVSEFSDKLHDIFEK